MNSKITTNDLLEKTIKIREKVEIEKEYISYKTGLIKTLINIQKLLSTQPLDLINLSKEEFGIFRMVTDGKGNSPLEKELLSLLDDFYLYRQAFDDK